MRLVSRNVAFSAALVLMAGTALAGSGLDAAARTTGPVTGDSVAVETEASDVAGAAVDLADAEAWLAELEAGNFANIFVIGNDGAMRCGEVEANSACKPLTDADKAGAIAEAREAVGFAMAAIEDAEESFAAEGGVQNASYAP
ncbi:MAG: hypothetical protein QM698_10055 [Micropepsaceae bacterium]